jgi:tetratricopeptide (TPR) repeat protein
MTQENWQGINLKDGAQAEIRDNIFNFAGPQRQTALHQMPGDIADFTGRSKELADLQEMLKTAEAGIAISALSGMGGIGKSALAIHLAHQLMATYDDVQLYVNLRGASQELELTPSDVLGGWLRNFGYEDTQVAGMDLAEREAHYRSFLQGKKAIVVLDNAAHAAQVRPLLPGSATAIVLITSRRSLATLAGVTETRLGVLAPDEALELLRKVAGRQWPGAEQCWAEQIVTACGQLPLAVRIAAATLKARPQWNLEKLAKLLATEQTRLRHLERDDLAVRVSFNLSYRELEPEMQQQFAALAAIPGVDFGVGVAAAVLESETAVEVLEQLAEAQLLETLPDERFGWHDLMRLYGREQLAVEAQQEQGLRAVQWYRAVADYCNDCLRRQLNAEVLGAQQATDETPEATKQRLLTGALAWFHTEWLNLQAAVVWAHGAEQWPEVPQLALLLDVFAMLQGHRGDLLRIYRLALDAAQTAHDRASEANTLKAIADVLQFKDRRDEALDNYQAAIAIYRQVGARLGEANTLQAIADVLQFKDRRDEALDNYQAAIAIYRQVGARLGEANTLQAIADVLQFKKRSDEALDNYQAAIAIYRQVGARLGEANTLDSLALVCSAKEEYSSALTLHQQAQEIFQGMKSRYDESWSHMYIARTHIKLGQLDQAQQSYTAAQTLFAAIGMDDLVEQCHWEMQPINQRSEALRAPSIDAVPAPAPTPRDRTMHPSPRSQLHNPVLPYLYTAIAGGLILFGLNLALKPQPSPRPTGGAIEQGK